MDTIARLLRRAGYRCVTAASAEDAIARLDVESPDLVVTDLHLPGIDGLVVARHARAHRPPIPVVLMSGYVRPETHRQIREAGEVVYLTKPFGNVDLLSAVQRAFGGPGHSSG